MERFVHNANIELYRLLIAERIDPSRDEDRHKMLLTLLAETFAKATAIPALRQTRNWFTMT